MLNIVAFIICALGAILQWNNNWWLFGINSTLAVLNLLIAIQWVIGQLRKRTLKFLQFHFPKSTQVQYNF